MVKFSFIEFSSNYLVARKSVTHNNFIEILNFLVKFSRHFIIINFNLSFKVITFQVHRYQNTQHCSGYRSNPPEVFLRKVILKIYRKFTGGHPCRSVISIKMFCNFIGIILRQRLFSCKFAVYFHNTIH